MKRHRPSSPTKGMQTAFVPPPPSRLSITAPPSSSAIASSSSSSSNNNNNNNSKEEEEEDDNANSCCSSDAKGRPPPDLVLNPNPKLSPPSPPLLPPLPPPPSLPPSPLTRPTPPSRSSSAPSFSSSFDGQFRTRVGMYELGRTLGEGNFAKVKLARHVATKKPFAIKIFDKEKILKHKLSDQVKREISTMKLVKHPNVVQLYEVMASKTKVYFVLEFAARGELLKKLRYQRRLSEDEARKYFQQLINAVNYCHRKGVFHRDLKPENLLLDADENLKISDFGLSALKEQCWTDGLLHTACGTPNYVAPEVICSKGYDGAKADLWSCGVILFVLMTGSLPFEDGNLVQLYKKIIKGEYRTPRGFPEGARKLIKRILTPNPKHRIMLAQVLEDPWFKEGYKPEKNKVDEEINIDDVNMVFNDSKDHFVTEKKEPKVSKPPFLNAFELISFSSGLNLSGLFETKETMKKSSSFTSMHPASEIISKMEETAKPLGFNVEKNDFKLKLQGVSSTGREGQLSVATEVFELGPSLFMVEVQKAEGDTQEYDTFCQNFSSGLKDIVYKKDDEKLRVDKKDVNA